MVRHELNRTTARIPFLVGDEDMRSIGHPVYSHQATAWSDILYASTGVGHVCSEQNEGVCARAGLVCRQGACQYCRKNGDCPLHHHCTTKLTGENHCKRTSTPEWEQVLSDPWLAIGSCLMFCASGMAAAAGVGGGGIMVPLLILCSGLTPNEAVPLSQIIVFTSSIINLPMFLTSMHPLLTTLPMIDYDCIVLMEPLLCAGVTLGVMLSLACPQWLILLLLCVTLLPAVWRTGTKGWKQWQEERARDAQGMTAQEDEPTMRMDKWLSKEMQCFSSILRSKHLAILMIIFVWVGVFCSTLHGFPVCSTRYFTYLAAIIACLFALTFVIGRFVVNPEEGDEVGVDWTAHGTFRYPGISLIAGFLGGLLGLGGGVVMSPVLLEIGMHTQAVQATTVLFVFLSSSIATTQYALQGRYVLHSVMWYCSIAVIGTALGQWACVAYVRKYKKYSLITLSIAAILVASLVCLVWVGAGSTYENFRTWEGLEFDWGNLCTGGQPQDGIVAPQGIQPAVASPKTATQH